MNAIKFMYVTFVFLLTVIWFSIGCKEDNPVGTNGSGTIIWQQTSLDSLRIFSLASHPHTGVLASSCSSPIFRTFNNGKTWESVFPNACPRTLAINSNGDIFSLSGAGFRRSTDNTASWTHITPFRSDLRAITFTHNHDIFIGSAWSDETPGGIYRSRDNGDTWMSTNFPDSISARILTTANEYVFVGTDFGVYRSADSGGIWEKTNNGFRNVVNYPFVSALVTHPLNKHLFLAIEGDGLYQTDDNGDNWIFTGLADIFIQSVVINAEGHIFAGNGQIFGSNVDSVGVFYSTDNGNTWTVIDSGLTNLNILSLAVDDSGYVYAGTHGDGVFRTMESTIYQIVKQK